MAAIIPIIMPKWGLSMKEGTVGCWLVEDGTEITVGLPILEVETDKIANAVEAPDAGLLRRKVATEGEVLPVKALLGVLANKEVSEADIDAYIAAFVVPAADADDEAQAGPSYQYVEVDGLRIRYARRGQAEGTPVLFIHGFGGDLDNWLFNIDAIGEKHPVIALDLPGHGQSAVKLPGTSLQALANFVARFMAVIDVPQAHLVGHSVGGAIAAQMALSQPQRVASLSLIDSAGFGPEINTGYTEGFTRAASRRELKPVLELLFKDPTLVSRQMVDDVLKYKRLDGVTELLESLNTGLFKDGQQVAQPGVALVGCDKPVLMVWGKDDQIVPAAHAVNAPAGATVAQFDGVGHMAQMERAGDVNRLILRHLGD
jgi:pyruvate dehydrogenase E2 component (dihydrolipoamide acetyltransferase)